MCLNANDRGLIGVWCCLWFIWSFVNTRLTLCIWVNRVSWSVSLRIRSDELLCLFVISIQSQCWRSDSVSSWITHKHPQMKIVLQDAGTFNKHCIKSPWMMIDGSWGGVSVWQSMQLPYSPVRSAVKNYSYFISVL